jgi:casein kinase II subunit beta
VQLEKYNNVQFGRCPRAYCCGQACLPVGTSDIPRTTTVKTYCPKCCDIYYTRNKYQGNIDGAYFGTTFPHLFLMTFSYLKSPRPTQVYTPRIFGFRVRPRIPPARWVTLRARGVTLRARWVTLRAFAG